MKIETEIKVTIKDVTISMTINELSQLKAALERIVPSPQPAWLQPQIWYNRYPYYVTLCATNDTTAASGTQNGGLTSGEIKLL